MSQNTDKKWGVMGDGPDGGAGWGRYATKAEAEARRDELLRMRHGEGGFVVVEVKL